MIPSFLPFAAQQPNAVTMIAAAVIGLTTLSGETNNINIQQPPSSSASTISTMIPVIEIIKVYGKLAGSECFGKQAPKGSSCEVTRNDIEKIFHLDDLSIVEKEGGGGGKEERSSSSSSSSSKFILTESEFNKALDEAEFQWPLKPYGISKSESNSKTATMNKGAETKVFMDILEGRGLYDSHNPSGPLPTSLRPKLNRQLQNEGLPPEVSHKIFQLLGGMDNTGEIDVRQIEEKIFQKTMATKDNSIDYYDFIELVGKESITWPY